MDRYRILCAALCFLSVSIVLAAEQSPRETKNGKPVYDVCTLTIAPSSLTEMYDESDAILDVRIVSSQARLVLGPFPRTFYTATVLRSFKGSFKEGDSVVFSHAAGDVELPDQILRANRETLSIGDRDIVFLDRRERYGGYILTRESEGAFKVSGGRIEPLGAGHVAAEQQHLTERQFIEEIAMAARRAKPKQ
jgi:hypothetical protein